MRLPRRTARVAVPALALALFAASFAANGPAPSAVEPSAPAPTQVPAEPPAQDGDPFAALGVPRAPRPDLTLLFTGSIEGFLEPCGCTAGRLGGMDRVVTHLRRAREQGRSTVYVDCGDVFLDNEELTPALRRQLPLKAEAIMAALAEAGCDAIGLGDYDLFLGVDLLRDLSQRYGVPVVASNLSDAKGEAVFERFVIVERDGLRIGVFSLLARNLVHPDPTDDRVLRVGELVESAGLKLRPWRETARNVVDGLRGEVDLLVCASHLGAEANQELADLCPEIDVVCGSHFAGLQVPHELRGTTMVSHVQLKGARVTEYDLWFGDRPPQRGTPFATGATDESARIEAEVTLEISLAAARNLVGRRGVLGPDEHARLEAVNKAYVQSAKDWLEAAAPFPSGRAFAITQQTVHRNLERDEWTLARLDAYHRELDALWASQPARRNHPNAVYPGPESCAACHPDQYDFWRTTAHSRAYSTLQVTDQHRDAECFYCHTVGFEREGGFDSPQNAAGYENVQCAACHGPGGGHVAGGASYLDESRLLKVGSTCLECHNKQHDPEFAAWVDGLPATADKVEAKVLRVACPPMPGPGLGSAAFRASLVEAGDALSRRGEVPWTDVVRAYHRAGELELAVGAARRALDDARVEGPGERLLGLMLLESGRDEEAVPYLRTALRTLGADVDVHFALARALMAGEPAAALVQAREAYSLDPSRPPHAEAVARGLQLTEGAAAARTFLAQHLERFPDQGTLFAPLLDELR